MTLGMASGPSVNTAIYGTEGDTFYLFSSQLPQCYVDKISTTDFGVSRMGSAIRDLYRSRTYF